MIINDKRYGALKTLGERKQAFHEVSLYKMAFCVCTHTDFAVIRGLLHFLILTGGFFFFVLLGG